MEKPKDNVVDFAAVRALRTAIDRSPMPMSARANEPVDADLIIIEATDALIAMTAENMRLRRLVEHLTGKAQRRVALATRLSYTAIGLAIGGVLASLLS
jgi:hypothetical protein